MDPLTSISMGVKPTVEYRNRLSLFSPGAMNPAALRLSAILCASSLSVSPKTLAGRAASM